MSDDWDYAQLAKVAKDYGGPKELIRKIKIKSYQNGQLAEKAKQNPKLFVMFGVGVLVTIGAVKLIEIFEKKFDKNVISDEEADEAEEMLIQQIKLAEQHENE
jgi:hypothetical protein